jgi:DNA polymerase III delta subunit
LTAAKGTGALYLVAEERRGAFDGWRADQALADIRRALEAGGKGGLAVHTYHAADCDPDAIVEAVETPSLFGARTLVVIRGAESFGESAQERLTRALERQAPQVTVAVVARGADMRRRLFARCRDLAQRVPVDHPRPREMPAWADRFAKERGCQLDADARAVLLEGIGCDLLLLASELDKLAAAGAEDRCITAAAVARVSVGGREHGNFEVADALCNRDARAATERLGRSLDEGAHPIALIGAIAASLRPVLAGAELVARGKRVDEAARAVGVAPYQRVAFERGVRAYRPGELRRALVRLAELDVANKTGMGDGRALLEEWVLALCLGAAGDRQSGPAAQSPRR